ncbi:MAG TPA: hypothetical protein VM619_00090 [Luteimonas sp.]|nr:hypothetical protein [Luteimonas sp.]
MHADPTPRFPLPALVLLLLGGVGIAAAWTLFSLAVGGQASWIAVLAALDAALLLRLGRMPAGWPRAACAVAGTVLCIALANWAIVATQVGRSLGLLPWDSLFRLGPDFTWTLVRLANDQVDLAWWGAALVVAVVAAR